MPTYEYACQSCGSHVEVHQRFNDEPLIECGICGGTLRKVFHPAGILFKGSGFYATDSRRGQKTDGGEDTSKVGDSEKAKAGKEKKAGDGTKAEGGAKAPTEASSSSGGKSPVTPSPRGAKERSA